ncbi:MAG TPA: CPBP family intramembrane glutamic endopeptidase [Gemmatimonadaceae bacterium]|nr:CPBP family intramembrane glutamic endopeptidase [Gemmatimonadaceae bacterium]
MPSLTILRGRHSYFAMSRAPRYSLVFALPLLLAYEALAASLTGPGHLLQVRNGADVMLKELFVLAAGTRGPLVCMAAIISLSIYFVVRDVRSAGQGIRPALFAGMLAESVALATLFGLVIGTITVKLLGAMHVLSIPPLVAAQPLTSLSWPVRLMLSLGAGLYEELLFRVLLVSALAAGARALFGWGLTAAGVFATVLGALIFSAFHYIGPYGDPFQLQSFVYRALSGIAFSAIYLTRGFGITAWTHALYDAFLLLG